MNLLNKINEVVVVEGYHDLALLKSIYENVDVIITNGSEISEDTLNELQVLNKNRGLILFLDPDYQGERIRRVINDFVGETKHAFLKKSQCINKNKTKVGIEHASKKDVIEALKMVYTENNTKRSNINIQDLYKLKLIGTQNSKNRRKSLCEEIGIGLANGKTLAKKLNMFGIDKEIVEKILEGE